MTVPVVILAGGLATRLYPITQTFPKSMVDVAGEPFIAHQLRLLHSNGIGEIVLCVGHLGEMIESFVGDGHQFGVRVRYSREGKNLLGTGGAIKKALPLLSETFMVLYGDSYLLCDYQAIAESFLAGGYLSLMTVYKNAGRWDTSNVEFEDGVIHCYDKVHRKETMQHIDYGLGCFRKEAFDWVPDGETFDLAYLYQRLLQSQQLAAFEVGERFYEIGSFEGLNKTREFLVNRKEAL